MFHKITHRTPRHGLLSEAERDAIQYDTISRQLKWKLTNPKKGKLIIGLKAIIKDFEIIFRSKKLVDWSYEHFVKEDIDKLERILSGQYSWHPIALKSLRVSRKDKVYYLGKIIVDEIPREGEKTSYFLEKMTNGLKDNEKKIIYDYYKKVHNFDLPLEWGKKYSWKQIQRKFDEDLKQVNHLKLQKMIKSEATKKIEAAWKLYHSRFTPKDKQKLAQLGVYFRVHAMIGRDK